MYQLIGYKDRGEYIQPKIFILQFFGKDLPLMSYTSSVLSLYLRFGHPYCEKQYAKTDKEKISGYRVNFNILKLPIFN